jgi:hypothetical protein
MQCQTYSLVFESMHFQKRERELLFRLSVLYSNNLGSASGLHQALPLVLNKNSEIHARMCRIKEYRFHHQLYDFHNMHTFYTLRIANRDDISLVTDLKG